MKSRGISPYSNGMEILRQSLLAAMLRITPFDGWTEHALAQAARETGTDDFALYRAFPNGARDVLAYFSDASDAWLRAEFPTPEAAGTRIPDRIRALLLARLYHWQPHREALRRAVSQRLLPWNGVGAVQALSHTADLLWTLAGDRSADFSYYTKRLTLAALYAGTVLFWLSDDSASQAETSAYLDRRLANLADFGRWKKKRFG